jgi:hypothetical protein
MAVLLNWVPKKCFFASLEPTCILIDQWDENEEIEFCDEFWLERILLKWKALWHKKTILPSPLTFEERRFISTTQSQMVAKRLAHDDPKTWKCECCTASTGRDKWCCI